MRTLIICKAWRRGGGGEPMMRQQRAPFRAVQSFALV
jgi:hypothetical protein